MEVSKRIISHQLSDTDFLIINTLTGAIDIANRQIYQFLVGNSGSTLSNIDNSVIDRLKQRGYLINSPEVETDLLLRFSHMLKKRKKDLALLVCPTYSCNLRCTYCFEGSITSENKQFMSVDDVTHVFNTISGLQSILDYRNVFIKLYGGEPLLKPAKGFIEGLLIEAKNKNIPVSIVTNGTTLTLFSSLLKQYQQTIQVVQVTLDGPAHIHDKRRAMASGKGTFSTICNSVDSLLSLNISTALRVNVDAQNITSIPELLKIFKNKGWGEHPKFTCSLAPVVDRTLASNYKYLVTEDVLLKKLLDVIKHNPDVNNVFGMNMFRPLTYIRSVLTTGRSITPSLSHCEANNLESLVLGPDGMIYACSECVGNPRATIGVFKPSLEFDENKFNMWNNRSILRMQKCMNCDIALLCGGGCAYSALLVNNNIDEPVCSQVRETIFAYLDSVSDTLRGWSPPLSSLN